MQHAFYAGLCDYFVTEDSKVKYILSDMIKPESPMVIGHQAFLAMIP